jgi:Uma2 family endonuclease
MTFEEYIAWEHEGGLAEWIDGAVVVHEMPTHEHQRIVEFLDRLLGLFVQLFGLGLIRVAPFPMRVTPEAKAREPDLFFLRSANRGRLESRQLNGPADLVVEVISNDSVARDRERKFAEYQAGGVPEYWIIDPRPGHERADFYVLDPSGHYQPASVTADGVYHATMLPGLWLRVSWLWLDDPNALAALAEIVGAAQMMAALQTKLDG